MKLKNIQAYCCNTNEKEELQQHIKKSFSTKPPIRILDLGCGTGIHTSFLSKEFRKSKIEAVNVPGELIEYAMKENNGQNINYQAIPFEQYITKIKFDFILMSHVLQYVKSPIHDFVSKALSLLVLNGQLWIVQHTKKGMAEILKHQEFFLSDQFKVWKTFEDYEIIIKSIVDKEYLISTAYLNTSWNPINFKEPTEEDKRRLEFIFCLNEAFDQQSTEFRVNLAKYNKKGRISHPNKILKIKRIK